VIYDNGEKVGDPVNLALAKHHEIVAAYGTASQLPPIQKSYNFPSGLLRKRSYKAVKTSLNPLARRSWAA